MQWRAFCDLAVGRTDPEAALSSIEAPHLIAAELERSTGAEAALDDMEDVERLASSSVRG
jgi:hypothetical protein